MHNTVFIGRCRPRQSGCLASSGNLSGRGERAATSPSAIVGKANDGRTKIDVVGYGDHYVPSEVDGKVDEDDDDSDDKGNDKKGKDNGESKRLV